MSILDPACGTGTFLYAVLDLIRERFVERGNAGMWSGYVREHLLPRLFGFELLMAPYAVAHFKIGLQLAGHDLSEAQRKVWAYDFSGDERLQIYLTNTLEEAAKKSEMLLASYISEEVNAAAHVKRDLPILVITGNPPYSGISANRGTWIDGLLKGQLLDGTRVPSYYEVDGKPLGEKKLWLQDDYVKFIRWGQWRIERTDVGILSLITNHGYLDNPTFRGMRQALMNTFTEIYIVDLHGNAKKKERAPDGSSDENVFDIQQGVAVGIFVKEPGRPGPAKVYHADLWDLRELKYEYLLERELENTDWKELEPTSPFYFFVPRVETGYEEYETWWQIVDIMPLNTTGIVTARDKFVVDFEAKPLLERIETFLNESLSDQEVKKELDLSENYAWRVSEARRMLKADLTKTPNLETFIKPFFYRPFDLRLIFYRPSVVWRTRDSVMSHILAGENIGMNIGRAGQVIGSEEWDIVNCTRTLVDFNLFRRGGNVVFPIYLYKDGRVPNLNPKFVADLEKRLGLKFVPDETGDLKTTFGPEDIFNYIYAVFHSPTYRTRYAEFLKIDFPRVPLTSNRDLFRKLCALGKELVALHLLESPTLSKLITRYPVPGDSRVEKGHPKYIAPGEPEPGTGKSLEQSRVYPTRPSTSRVCHQRCGSLTWADTRYVKNGSRTARDGSSLMATSPITRKSLSP
jgi:predicted helicase